MIGLLTITLTLPTQVSVLAASENSSIPTNSWTLQIQISPNNTVALSLSDLYAMPKTTVFAELSCYSQFITSGWWGGVRLGALLEKAGYNGQTANLKLHASDGYTVPFSLTAATPDNVIIAYELDGTPLAETLRLVIPGSNGEAWISMITEISINNSINEPVYPDSANPNAASVVEQYQIQIVQPSPTPQPSPTTRPKAQPTAQPTVPTPTNIPFQQQNTSTPSSQIEYGYQIILGIIITSAIAITAFLGYHFYKPKHFKDS